MTKGLFIAALFGAAFLTACKDGDDSPVGPAPVLARTVSMCQTSMPVPQLKEMLDGNLAIAAGFREDGIRSSEIVSGLVIGLVLNTLDFQALDRWGASFSRGVYRVRNGGNNLQLVLRVEEDFGEYHAGDTIRENLFNPESYVRSPRVNLSGEVSYDRGPMYNLITGSISWKSLEPRLRLDVTKLSLVILSESNWYASWLGIHDTLFARMTTTSLQLSALKQDFKNGRIGFSYDSTTWASSHLQLNQRIYGSLFEMKPLDEQGKKWSWEGGYRSRVDKVVKVEKGNQPLRVFIKGSVSTVNGNRTGYYCDDGFQDSVGFTVDDTSGTWGYFKSLHGDSIPYGLYPVGN